MKVYMGFDPRESEIYKVAEYSLKKHNPTWEVIPLIQDNLRESGLYTRPKNEKTSTQFTFTRFLCAHLSGYKGRGMFMDCDVLITGSLEDIEKYANPDIAVACVKHNYETKVQVKMDGQVQKSWPRHNWSSVILFNFEHSANKQLNPELINTATPAFLHQFKWLEDKYIGELPLTYNFLVGEYKKPDYLPKICHMTLGSPTMIGYENCDYSELWWQTYNEMEKLI